MTINISPVSAKWVLTLFPTNTQCFSSRDHIRVYNVHRGWIRLKWRSICKIWIKWHSQYKLDQQILKKIIIYFEQKKTRAYHHDQSTSRSITDIIWKKKCCVLNKSTVPVKYPTAIILLPSATYIIEEQKQKICLFYSLWKSKVRM